MNMDSLGVTSRSLGMVIIWCVRNIETTCIHEINQNKISNNDVNQKKKKKG